MGKLGRNVMLHGGKGNFSTVSWPSLEDIVSVLAARAELLSVETLVLLYLILSKPSGLFCDDLVSKGSS